MNKHGQTLILFVILIPLLILLLAVIIDTGIVIKEKIKLNDITKETITSALNNSLNEEEIKELFKENNIDITNIKITISNNEITIYNEISVESVFGSIIGIKNYKIKINIKGYQKENKIVFE